jgi:murein DD-endopeptidase MepM/ murein hydrolase activator NlpD
VTYARDYRGGRLSYDGHVGTDFAVPAGTPIVAAAPGVVTEVRKDMQRGGLKVCIDHGGGLITTSNHLSRALVEPGNLVKRGEPIGLSGMSGVDGVLFFPWLAPHLHFNVLLDGVPVDPFAADGEVSLWRAQALPEPHRDEQDDGMAEATRWDRDAVAAAIASCRDADLRQRLTAEANDDVRAAKLAVARLFLSHRFERRGRPLVDPGHERRPWLDLPLRAEDYDGVVFADELGGG